MLIQRKVFTFYYYPAESISNPSSVTFLLTKTEMNSTSLPRFPVDIESENKHKVSQWLLNGMPLPMWEDGYVTSEAGKQI